jgi:general secretion pathway protein G
MMRDDRPALRRQGQHSRRAADAGVGELPARDSQDPFTNSSDTWQTTEAEPQPGSTTAEPGIYEVKSGSDGNAIDGSKFSDW